MDQTARPSPVLSPTLLAALWMTGAIASFSAMAVAGRAVSLELDTFELMTWRSLVGIAIVLSIGLATGRLRTVTTRHMGWHVIRNLCHFAGQNLWFLAVTMIPLAQVFALEFTSPLWVVVLAPLVLGERLTAMRALAAVLGFIGVLIIAQPWVGNLGPGVIAAAAAAIGFAGSAVFTRRLTRTESVTCILFWLTALQAVFGLACAGWDGDITLPSTATAPWLVLIGCAGLLAHFCLTRALSLAPATVVIPIDFTRLPLIALIGYLVYGEAVGAEVYLGASIIIAANLLNLRSETRR